jgi:hypothetical protein
MERYKIRPYNTEEKAKHTGGGAMATSFTKNLATETAQRVQASYANTKDAAQKTLARARETAQSRFKTNRKATRDTLTKAQAKVQESTKVGLGKAQNWLTAVLSVVSAIVALLYEMRHKTQKKLRQAQISLAKTTTPIVEKTRDAVVTSTKKAGKGLQKTADNTKEARASLQDWYANYRRRHRRSRALFRIGLLAGVVLAFFYTPITGSDIRQRIAEQWRRYRPRTER